MNQILAAYLAKSKVLFFFAIKVSSKACSVVSTQSARQYEDKFRQHYNNFTVANLREPNRFGQDCYDATWILALALNNTLTGMVLMQLWFLHIECNSILNVIYCLDLKENSTLNSRAAAEAGVDGEFKLENFTYTTSTILETLSGHLSRTNFSGITVRQRTA